MANTLPQTEPCIGCGQGDFTPKEAVIFPSDGREEDRWIADSEAGVYDTDMPALPQTVYVQRGPNDGDLQVHDHGGFGGEEYVPKAAPVAAGGVDIVDQLVFTARVGSASYSHSALMDNAARKIIEVSAELEAMRVERDAMKVGRDTMGELWARSETERTALASRVAELTKAIEVAIDASQTELNLGNYDHDDVCALQTEAIQIWSVLRAALAKEEPKP